MSSLGQMGELALIERICSQLTPGSDVPVGVGDDCAVVEPGGGGDLQLVLTSDPVVSGVHFSPDVSPELIGRKAVGRVLSDLAAMGATPRWLLINVSAPAALDCSVIDGVYAGAVALADRFGASIVGGDVAEAGELSIHAFGVGSLPRGTAVQRGGGSAGDALFVTGALGGSLLSGRHLAVEPRVHEGCWLRAWASAMIDVSDGLASDLGHLLAAGGVGCRLHATEIPISDAARSASDGRSPLDHALQDGEDFELLFSVPESRVEPFLMAWRGQFELPVTRIGTFTDAAGGLGLVLSDGSMTQLGDGGFRHFSP